MVGTIRWACVIKRRFFAITNWKKTGLKQMPVSAITRGATYHGDPVLLSRDDLEQVFRAEGRYRRSFPIRREDRHLPRGNALRAEIWRLCGARVGIRADAPSVYTVASKPRRCGPAEMPKLLTEVEFCSLTGRHRSADLGRR